MAVGRFMVVLVCAVALPLPLGSADGIAGAQPEAGAFSHVTYRAERPTPLEDSLDAIGARVRTIQEEANELEVLLSPEVTTIRRVLARQGATPELAALVAGSLVREGHRRRIAPSFLLAVMLVENPWIDPEARSHMGAIGLMQVMPFHAGEWGCPAGDLTIPEVNICHGTEILAHALAKSDGDLDRALLRYNGCVLGTNTPKCHGYPSWVREARASVERLREDPVEKPVPSA